MSLVSGRKSIESSPTQLIVLYLGRVLWNKHAVVFPLILNGILCWLYSKVHWSKVHWFFPHFSMEFYWMCASISLIPLLFKGIIQLNFIYIYNDNLPVVSQLNIHQYNRHYWYHCLEMNFHWISINLTSIQLFSECKSIENESNIIDSLMPEWLSFEQPSITAFYVSCIGKKIYWIFTNSIDCLVFGTSPLE